MLTFVGQQRMPFMTLRLRCSARMEWLVRMSDVKRKRLSISAAAVVMVIAVAAIAFWPGEKEPEYQGKKLSEWLEIYRTNDVALRNAMWEPWTAAKYGPKPRVDRDAAAEAVRHIGTNALPWLLATIQDQH